MRLLRKMRASEGFDARRDPTSPELKVLEVAKYIMSPQLAEKSNIHAFRNYSVLDQNSNYFRETFYAGTRLRPFFLSTAWQVRQARCRRLSTAYSLIIRGLTLLISEVYSRKFQHSYLPFHSHNIISHISMGCTTSAVERPQRRMLRLVPICSLF